MPRPDPIRASLTSLAASSRLVIRPACRGAVVSITERGRLRGYLCHSSQLAGAGLRRREPVTATTLSKQAGLLLDLLAAGDGDLQPVTVAGVEVLALVPVRVWRG